MSTLSPITHLRQMQPRAPKPVLLPGVSPVKAQLERILGSRVFAGAHRSQLFLRYIVGHHLAHPGEPLKEYSIALDVFHRDAYDPAVNNTVRVEAGRLRSRLRDYYAAEGHADPLLIGVPKGSYYACIHPREPAAPTPAPTRSLRYWAIPVAFLVGALLGYSASR